MRQTAVNVSQLSSVENVITWPQGVWTSELQKWDASSSREVYPNFEWSLSEDYLYNLIKMTEEGVWGANQGCPSHQTLNVKQFFWFLDQDVARISQVIEYLSKDSQRINMREHLYFNVNLSMTFVCNAQLYLNALFWYGSNFCIKRRGC